MLENLLVHFVQDPRIQLIVALIVADWVTGVAAALRRGSFDFAKLGRFMLTNVLPYLLVYLLVYAFDALSITPLLGPVVGDLVNTGWFGVIVTTLAGSIYNNVRDLDPAGPPPGGPSHVV